MSTQGHTRARVQARTHVHTHTHTQCAQTCSLGSKHPASFLRGPCQELHEHKAPWTLGPGHARGLRMDDAAGPLPNKRHLLREASRLTPPTAPPIGQVAESSVWTSELRGLYLHLGALAGPLPWAAGGKDNLPLATPVRTHISQSHAFDSRVNTDQTRPPWGRWLPEERRPTRPASALASL